MSTSKKRRNSQMTDRELRAAKRPNSAVALSLCKTPSCAPGKLCSECWWLDKPTEKANGVLPPLVHVVSTKHKRASGCKACDDPRGDLVLVYSEATNVRVCTECIESKKYVACGSCCKFNLPGTKVCSVCGGMDLPSSRKPKVNADTIRKQEMASGKLCLVCNRRRTKEDTDGRELGNGRWQCARCISPRKSIATSLSEKIAKKEFKALVPSSRAASCPAPVRDISMSEFCKTIIEGPDAGFKAWISASPRETFAAFTAVYAKSGLKPEDMLKEISAAISGLYV